MRRLALPALMLAAVIGCTTPKRDVIDVMYIDGCDGFDWNGRVEVTMSYKGLFRGTTVDAIRFESWDGRTLLLDTTGGTVDTYVKAKFIPPPAEDSGADRKPSP